MRTSPDGFSGTAYAWGSADARMSAGARGSAGTGDSKRWRETAPFPRLSNGIALFHPQRGESVSRALATGMVAFARRASLLPQKETHVELRRMQPVHRSEKVGTVGRASPDSGSRPDTRRCLAKGEKTTRGHGAQSCSAFSPVKAMSRERCELSRCEQSRCEQSRYDYH